ncbi:hypothetical protein LINPERPRIM_LOCUS16896 [Linum perenne]
MASLATHFSAAILLLPVGIRRLFTSSSLYLNNPSQFRSKVWYFSDPKWKNLDFFILTVALPIASFSELFLFLSFPSHPTYRFAFLHQSLILFLFCHGNAELNCVLDQDAFRGEALASLLFLGHSIFVLLLSFGVFGLFSSDNRFRYRETSGPLLAGLDSENRVLRTIGESEFE